MAKASKHDMGAGAQGKQAGVGAMTDAPDDQIGENMVLSNRDKSRHPETRGYDSKRAQTEQMQENPHARDPESDNSEPEK